jgi:hypothetical protein
MQSDCPWWVELSKSHSVDSCVSVSAIHRQRSFGHRLYTFALLYVSEVMIVCISGP